MIFISFSHYCPQGEKRREDKERMRERWIERDGCLSVQFEYLGLQNMEEIVDLDESPIDCDGQQPINSQSSHSDSSQEQGMFDSETFKGSFLQEMEKMYRPLKYDRVKHNIYAHEDETSEDNILAFIEHEETETKFSFELQAQDAYIIDFNSREEGCCCKCHEKESSRESSRAEKLQQRRNSNDSGSQAQREGNEKERPRKECEKNWISLSLKEYKMKIKRKLQQKR